MKMILLATVASLAIIEPASATTPAWEWKYIMGACLSQLPYPTSRWMQQHEIKQCRHAVEWQKQHDQQPDKPPNWPANKPPDWRGP